jgi:protein gp37
MSTKIEWVRNPDGTKGKTWNPVTGCTPVSAGCAHCYAKRMARRLAGRCGYPEAPHHFDVTLHPKRLDIPLRRKKPTTYFVCSMSDLFHEDVSPSFICEIWQVMRECPQHTFQILTKRAQRMFEIVTTYIANDALGFAPLPNVWGLVTAENQTTADERIPWLLQAPFAVRGVSCEPMLGPVYLKPWLSKPFIQIDIKDEDWARSLRDQCQVADVPFFFKQWGAFTPYPPIELCRDDNQYQVSLYGGYWPIAELGRHACNHQTVNVYRVGKKAAGHLLDGREHHEFPHTSVDTAPDP